MRVKGIWTGEPAVPGGSVTVKVARPVYIAGVWALKFSGVIMKGEGVAPFNGETENQLPDGTTAHWSGWVVPKFLGVT